MIKQMIVAAAVAAAGLAAAGAARADGLTAREVEEIEGAGGTGPAAEAEREPSRASLTAKLVDEKANAARATARIEVKVKGMSEPRLLYKVDDGPAVETSDTTISVRNLTPGAHKITVLLAGEDSAPLGPSETLSVTIP